MACKPPASGGLFILCVEFTFQSDPSIPGSARPMSPPPGFQISYQLVGNNAFAGVVTDGSKPHVSYSSRIATARVNPAEAALILNGKAETVKPVPGSWSRLVIFSIWQYP
jgi:hypothetical protein